METSSGDANTEDSPEAMEEDSASKIGGSNSTKSSRTSARADEDGTEQKVSEINIGDEDPVILVAAPKDEEELLRLSRQTSISSARSVLPARPTS